VFSGPERSGYHAVAAAPVPPDPSRRAILIPVAPWLKNLPRWLKILLVAISVWLAVILVYMLFIPTGDRLTVLWSQPVSDHGSYYAKKLILLDDRIIAVDEVDPGLVAFSLAGDELWRESCSVPVHTDPVLINNIIFAQPYAPRQWMPDPIYIDLDGASIDPVPSKLDHGGINFPVYTGESLVYLHDMKNLTALDASFEELWTYQAPNFVLNQLTADQTGRIYFSTCGLNPTNRTFICLEPDGTEAWRYSFITSDYSSPQFHGGMVYVSTHLGLYAFDRQGNVLWHVLPQQWVNSSPLVAGDSVLCTTDDVVVNAFDFDGNPLWQTEPLVKRMLPGYVANFMLRLPDGRVVIFDAQHSVPRISELLLGYDSVEASLVGGVTLLDPADGTVLNRFMLPNPVTGSPVVGPDGTLYAVTCDGMLNALRIPE